MLHCGLLGERLGHSYSPEIHKMLADYEYRLYEKSPDELEDFLTRGEWDGLNVTIPYKRAVMPYCAELSGTARRAGSVNTLVRRPDGSIFGDNTDVWGFRCMLERSGVHMSGKKALVLGSGGASGAVRAVLEDKGADSIITVSRRGKNNYENAFCHPDVSLIVNATPVGMFPNNGECRISVADFPACQAVLDLVYNPARTELLMQAEELGIKTENGLLMLVAQAKRSCELFTGREIPESETDRVLHSLRARMRSVILIGMPGCGKTAVGERLAQLTGRTLLDSDREIVRMSGMSIQGIFAQEGEAGFRSRESAALAELGKMSGCIIATGGGCVTRAKNYRLLHQNGVIVWLRRDVDKLERTGRPLSVNADLDAMYDARKGLYRRFSDLEADNNGTLDDTVKTILELIK